VLLRGTLVLIAAAAIVFGVTRLHGTDACDDAKRAGFAFAAIGHGPAGSAERLATKVADNCRDTGDLAATSSVLVQAGALAPAERMARTAVARDPRGYLGWISLAIVLQRRREPRASRAAARRALALNPRSAAVRELASPRGAGVRAGP
jgi:Flp pilus assembly protein TadD